MRRRFENVNMVMGNYFYNYIDIQIRNFNDNPIPDFYVGVVDKVGD